MNLKIDIAELGISAENIVNNKNETQLLAVLKLIIGIILKAENDTWIEYMTDMEERNLEEMHPLCEEALNLMDSFPKIEEGDNSFDHDELNIGGDIHGSSLVDQKYIDNINSLNFQVDSLQNEKT